MLPSTIPIFPLHNVVLFPQVFLPLHIFEPRYREMVEDALEGDRMIGMVLLKPGWEADYEGRPPVYPVGCAGLITHSERLPDGRFNIILRGLEKFRIVEEDRSRAYRVAAVETLAERIGTADREGMRRERPRLEALLATGNGEAVWDPKASAAVPDEEFVHALAQYLELEPVEKQALLERPGILSRFESLIELLEMKLLATGDAWGRNGMH